MIYAKIINGEVAAYPYTFAMLRADYPDTSFPADYDISQNEDVVVVQPTAHPTPSLGEQVTPAGIEQVEGVWQQVWAIEPAPVPSSVSARQARLALLGAGLLGDVEAALNSLSSPEKEAALIEWEYATEIRRDSPLVVSVAVGLGLSCEQIDQLFIAGDGL